MIDADACGGDPDPAEPQPGAEAAPPRTVRSADLFPGDSRRLVIEHDGREYVLIVTRHGKLVLNRMT